MADSQNVVTVTDENFSEVVGGAGNLVMVDFWAVWCGPCRLVAPIVESLADQYAGQVTVGKVDVDSNPRLSSQFNVRSIPSLLFFRDGQVVDTVVGAVPKPVLERKIQEHLGAAA
jgi:thioredoxin 1